MLPILAIAIVIAPLGDIYVEATASCAGADGSASAPYCTTHDALAAAVSGDRLLIAPGTYPGNLNVAFDLEIEGTGDREQVILDGQGTGSVLTTAAGTTVSLRGVTLTGGVAGSGGAVEALGNLNLYDSTFSGNATGFSNSGNGGAVHFSANQGTLLIEGCVFEGNSAAGFGGALHAGTLSLSTRPSSVVIRDSKFLGNFAMGGGGAIDLECNNWILEDSEVAGNSAGATDGGGLLARDFGVGLIDRCSIHQNFSGIEGGGVFLRSFIDVTVRNTTVSRCSAPSRGGGIFMRGFGGGAALIEHCTVTENSAMTGGGIYSDGISGLAFRNSILVDNMVSGSGAQSADVFGDDEGTSLGFNLFGALDGVTTVPTDLTGVTGVLEPLRFNGGPGQSHEPLEGSPAIDGADPLAALPVDQRGSTRPTAAADIGAIERFGRSVACAPVPNSTGQAAYCVLAGDEAAAANSFTLVAGGLQPGRFGFFIVSPIAGVSMNPGGSQGVQCISGAVGRLNRPALNEVVASDSAGSLTVDLDLTQLATPTGTESVMAGDTRLFQLWYRDANPGPTSNFSSAVGVTFR